MKFIGLLSAAALGVAAAQVPVGRVDVSARAVAGAASAYVVAFEKEFAFLVADESSEQRVEGRDALGPFKRSLISEVFLTYLPSDGEWIAIRDVLSVNGTPTTREQTVRDLLTRADERRVAEQVLKANARYNLGSVERNFNEPTLPLLLLEPKRVHRIKFNRRAVTREGDITLVTLGYEEPDVMTLVGGPLGAAQSRGEFVIDAAAGTVRRTVFTLQKRDIRARLETTYEFEPRLKLWLPATFQERYERTGSFREVTTVESRYTNYRRFEGSGRIKK